MIKKNQINHFIEPLNKNIHVCFIDQNALSNPILIVQELHCILDK